MDVSKESNAWMSVPQFGDWDQKHGMTDYSMDFSKIREMRKQNKKELSRASLGNEEELINPHQQIQHQQPERHHPVLTHDPPATRKKILSYFNCCIKA